MVRFLLDIFGNVFILYLMKKFQDVSEKPRKKKKKRGEGGKKENKFEPGMFYVQY